MEKDDKWVWKKGETSNYTVKLASRILKGEVKGKGMSTYEIFWRIKTLPSTQPQHGAFGK